MWALRLCKGRGVVNALGEHETPSHDRPGACAEDKVEALGQQRIAEHGFKLLQNAERVEALAAPSRLRTR